MQQLGSQERLSLWLNYGVEHYVRRYEEVVQRFASLEEAFLQCRSGRTEAFDFLPHRSVMRLREAAHDGFMDRFIERLDRLDIRVCMPYHEQYPELLREIADPPSVLYYRGRLVAAPPLALAVIGTRKPSGYGRDVAHVFAHGLAQAGAAVVSGMAMGIDACAAQGALACASSAYPTVAVLGTGVDVVYPAGNEDLYEAIVARGAVVSEFLPGTPSLPQHFPIRNRIISGMSHGVVVVESGERSGTSITVGYAHDEGREVFAIPGRITDTTSIGTNGLICRGEAKPVASVDDVLCEFAFAPKSQGEMRFVGKQTVSCDTLLPQEQAIVRALSQGERSIDELCETLSMPPGQLNSFLTGLQFSGIIKQLPGRLYGLDTMRTSVK